MKARFSIPPDYLGGPRFRLCFRAVVHRQHAARSNQAGQSARQVGNEFADGERRIEAMVQAIGKEINGWHVGSAFGDRAFYNGNWLLRAAAAKAGIYGNDAAEAMYQMITSTADGAPLDGARDKYALTFAKGQ